MAVSKVYLGENKYLCEANPIEKLCDNITRAPQNPRI